MADSKPRYSGSVLDVVNESMKNHLTGLAPTFPGFGTFRLDRDVYINAHDITTGKEIHDTLRKGLYYIDLESDRPGSYNAAKGGNGHMWLYAAKAGELKIGGEGEGMEEEPGIGVATITAEDEEGKTKYEINVTLEAVRLQTPDGIAREEPISVEEVLLWAAENDLEEAGEVDRATDLLSLIYEDAPKQDKPKKFRHESIAGTQVAIPNDKIHKTLLNHLKDEDPITPAMFDGRVICVDNGKAKSRTELQLKNETIPSDELERVTSYFDPQESIYIQSIYGIACDNPDKTTIHGIDVLKTLGIKRPTRPDHQAALVESANTAWKMLSTWGKFTTTGAGKSKRGYKHYMTAETYRRLIEGSFTAVYYTIEEEDAKALEDKAKAAAKRAKAAGATPEMKAEAERLAEEAKEAGTLAKAAKEKRLEALANHEEPPSRGKMMADWYIDLMFTDGDGEHEAKDAFPLLQYADTANEIFHVPEEYLVIPGNSSMDIKRVAAEIYRHAASKIAHPETFKLDTLMQVTGTPQDKSGRRRIKERIKKVLDYWESQGFVKSWEFTTAGARGIVDGFVIHGFVKDGRRVVEIGENEGE